jgi:uncharacterized membrane protein YkvA (DUF1232 family)
MGGLTGALKHRFLRFRREILVVGYAVRHPETPVRLRIAGLALILYLASPIDLVPIVIPLLGILDDLILVPWGLGAVVRRLPPDARADAEAGAARFIGRYVAGPIRFLLLLLLVLALLWTLLLWFSWWALVGR